MAGNHEHHLYDGMQSVQKIKNTMAKNNNNRYSMVIALLMLTTMAGCDSGRNLVGSWACQTQNPNGSISQDNFTFNDDATFRSTVICKCWDV